jgi:hypothetical protein
VGDDGDVANTWVQVENSSGVTNWGLVLLYYGEELWRLNEEKLGQPS